MVDDQFGEDIYVDEYTKYDKTGLHRLFGELYAKLDEAEQVGFNDAYIQFRSTIEPYESYPGPVELQVRGDRELSESEKDEKLEQKRIQTLATKLGVTYYEASIIDRLERAKKVNLT